MILFNKVCFFCVLVMYFISKDCLRDEILKCFIVILIVNIIFSEISLFVKKW